MIGFVHGYEWLIILVIALLLFGHRIPSMARSLGSGITEFKKGLKSDDKEDSKKLPPPGDRHDVGQAKGVEDPNRTGS